jgi:8-oxo-dGTP pyrophosphatase MutT (NUDIX family)
MDARTAHAYTAEDFRVRALRARAPSGDDFGDHALNPQMRPLIVREGLTAAAVLVPVVDRGREASVILTTRTERLRSHSGQIAFPGGRIDPGDPSPEFAALRETEEEIGVGRDSVEVLGRLPDYYAGSGYRIAPVLGLVRPDYMMTINEDEVADAFEVPLSFLMDPANHRRDSKVWNERERFFYTMPFGERHIWGVTAGIIRTLYERLYA